MENYKAVILGPQCSGKTTLKKYLQNRFVLPLVEEDEMFTDLNGGTYPSDIEYKEKVLRPELDGKIRKADNIIFLTSYCNPLLLRELKTKGFKVIQLILDKEEFDKRNKNRMKEEGYEDANLWAKEVFDFHSEIRNEGLVDKTINANEPTEAIAKEVLSFLQ